MHWPYCYNIEIRGTFLFYVECIVYSSTTTVALKWQYYNMQLLCLSSPLSLLWDFPHFKGTLVSQMKNNTKFQLVIFLFLVLAVSVAGENNK